MIGQYLPQTNESATVAKSKNFSYVNKAHVRKSAGLSLAMGNALCDTVMCTRKGRHRMTIRLTATNNVNFK